MKKIAILAATLLLTALGAYAQTATQTLNKKNPVIKEWNTVTASN